MLGKVTASAFLVVLLGFGLPLSFALATGTAAPAAPAPAAYVAPATDQAPPAPVVPGSAACTVTVSDWNPLRTGDAYSFNVPTLADALASVQPYTSGVVPANWWVDCADGVHVYNG